MKKAALAILMTIAVGGGTMSASSTAHARCYGCAIGAGVAAGVIGGAIIGSAIANQRHYYGAHAYYAGPPRYYAPPPDDAVEYCIRRFKSYDPRSGTYLGYDGYRHPCP
jgi:BA14K-like protein